MFIRFIFFLNGSDVLVHLQFIGIFCVKAEESGLILNRMVNLINVGVLKCGKVK